MDLVLDLLIIKILDIPIDKFNAYLGKVYLGTFYFLKWKMGLIKGIMYYLSPGLS